MKKNKMMRLASSLLVAVLLTSSVISGTFAKYVTEGSNEDSARVAKFGVAVVATGNLFDTTYKKATENTPGEGADDSDSVRMTVESSNSEKVVAPGTKNDQGLKIQVTGTPEVDVIIDVEVETSSDIYLEDYKPLKYSLHQTSYTSNEGYLVKNGTLDDVVTALNGLNNQHFDANQNLDTVFGTLTLTWEWAYEVDEESDKYDTLLGDIQADSAKGASYDYCLNTGIKFKVTVTQED